jgi:hypothetical protein
MVTSGAPRRGENQQAGRRANFWEQLLDAAAGHRLKWFLLLPLAGVMLALFGAWLHRQCTLAAARLRPHSDVRRFPLAPTTITGLVSHPG